MPTRRLLFRALLLLPLSTGAACAHPAGNPPAMPDTQVSAAKPAPVQLIVSFKDDVSPAAMADASRAVGATLVRSMDWAHAIVVTLPADMSAEQGISRFKAQPGVMGVEMDRRLQVNPIRGPKIGK
ncbi:S8 family serine peptidase [Dyella koreensis]|uniref:Fervidolysin-like N-terminal prodomain domain-containing protein n=1 Tax=Dyella koreensis TaxID=311235 RepID=A0ABW8JYH4_9GAMM